ncbi:type IV pilus secretin PilQ [Aestuariibacter salexigens]|uniref:type IV pilus secretin PilQ n=1 Tax=Aestuariibacter salexigens TaxID=226010 RepID=UPI00040F6360|nr:type IV pilus secretin PilQ family protein [Aestuariibacter salexigens]
MSERYIFNKKLNRSHHKLWMMLALLAMIAVAFSSVAQQNTPPPLLDPYAETQQDFAATLIDVAFTRTSDGAGRTVFTFDNDDFKSNFVEAQNKLFIQMPATAIADDQLFQLDVVEFGTPITLIETFQEDKDGRIEMLTTGATRFTQQRDGNSLIVEIQPVSEQEQQQQQTDSLYSGKPISLDFQDVPVRQVLQIIAQVNGFNLVTTDTVSGNVTINLNSVPWDQALDMILKIKGLGKRLEGNILLIAPSEELSARETQELQSQQQVQELAPLRIANVTVNYAKAEEMATLLRNAEGGILSARGTVSVDERTNTLLIRDTQESIDEARALIEALDIPVRQVLIESRMVTVRDNVDEQLGVRWGFTDQQNDDGVSGSLQGAETVAGGVIPALSDRLNVNLPVTSAAGRIGFQVASLVDGTILDLELSALESENKGEIIASPRITVANQQEAYIEQGTEIPYVQATSSGATSVEFKKAVLSLKVTPHITPDNRIILNLVVTQDTRGETLQTSTGPAVAIDTQEISTQVLVNNGETIVLGGIFQQQSTQAESKVPLFGDLPVVGALFRNKQVLDQKRELLIFVTPKILTDSL